MFTAHLALLFSVQVFIVAILFFLKKQSRTGNVLLGLVMLIISFQHFMHYLWATRQVYNYTWLLNIDLPLDGCWGVLMYFYIKVMTGEKLQFKWQYLLHLWPLPLGLAWYIYFNLQPRQFQLGFINSVYREVPAIAAVINLLVAVYMGLGYRKLSNYIKTQPTTQWTSGYSNLLWLRQFIGILFVLNICVAPMNLIARFEYIIAGFPAITAFIMLFVVYKTFNHPEVMTTEMIRKFNRQLEYQREIEKVRRQISNDIHDELGAGLTRVSMLGELGKMKYRGDKEIAGQFAALVGISHQLMGALREVVWAINPLHDNLESLLAFLRQYISHFYEASDIQVEMDFTEGNKHIAIDPYVRRNLILVIKEAGNNVIKHANASAVIYSIRLEANLLHLTIADNGCGLKNGNILGNGLKGMQARMAEMGGTVQTAGDSSGFKVSIRCPIHAQRLQDEKVN